MTTLSHDKVQLNVRVEPRVVGLLDARIAQARRSGRRVTKEQLVSDAITTAYEQEPKHGWLPVVHGGTWNAPPETLTSNAALLDWLDEQEAAQA
ncbi:MAG: hypothetical protein FWC46_08510 [Actinomycetia bacterium]|nr:hypothetical protein [Actinomycetes bacterium]